MMTFNKRFVIGDIHGNYKALIQVLEKSNFNKDEDLLIGIGDYCDGGPDTVKVIKYLIDLPNFIGIRGNHDIWLEEFLKYMLANRAWLKNGGYASTRDILQSELNTDEFIKFHDNLHSYYIDENNNVFVHGGWTVKDGIEKELIKSNYYWDRKLWTYSLQQSTRAYTYKRISRYNKVFVGHTETGSYYPDLKPVQTLGKLWNIDQGAGWSGKLTIMDIDSEEYWQSDRVIDLYEVENFRKMQENLHN